MYSPSDDKVGQGGAPIALQHLNQSDRNGKTGAAQALEDDSFSLLSGMENSKRGGCGWSIMSLKSVTETWIANYFFPGMPSHFTLGKRMLIQRVSSNTWAAWDLLQIMLTLLGCVSFVITQYPLTYDSMRIIFLFDIVLTQSFAMDLVLHWYMFPGLGYFTDMYVLMDMAAMLPAYLMLFVAVTPIVRFLRCLRVMRLARILRSLKFMHNTTGIKRQVVYLTLTLVIMIYLSSCVTQFLENYFEGMYYGCVHISKDTNWAPACSKDAPADPVCLAICEEMTCLPRYGFLDEEHHPTDVTCTPLSFFDAFYYIIITLSTIGFGDVILKNNYARAANIFFIIATVVLIPMRLSELQTLLSLTNPFAKPYVSAKDESHIIVTGHTSDKKKLENFLKEFYHPDRTEKDGEEVHTVILASAPPTEDIRSLLLGHSLESKVTWVLGTPLSITDLKKVKAETATAIFFLVNADLYESMAKVEDASIVLAALSVGNFNSKLTSFVQVLRPENGDILQDSDVDMILCLDEYKTAVQARNAVCPGFSTFIENIFHSMGSVSAEIEKNMPPWYEEYLHGAGMELYFVPLPANFLKAMRYSFRRICEVIYLEWGCITLGVCQHDKGNVVLNPLGKDLFEFVNVRIFYEQFNVALIMADDQHMADEITKQLSRVSTLTKIIRKAMEEDIHHPCNNFTPPTPAAPATPLEAKKKFTAGLNRFKNAAKTVARAVAEGGPAASPFATTITDNRFNLSFKGIQKPKNAAKSMGDAALMLTRNASNQIFSPSAVLRKPVDGNHSDDDDKTNNYYTDDDDGSSDEDEKEEYIGFRKKLYGSAQPFYEGFGLSRTGAKTMNYDNELRMSVSAASNVEIPPRSTDNSVSGSENTEEDSDDDDDEDDFDSNNNAANLLSAFLENSIAKLGVPSCILKDASHLTNHVIVCGCESNLHMFIGELRRPAVSGDTYHPILVVHAERPSSWHYIEETYNDVFLMEGDPTRPSVLKKMALKQAFSISLMGSRSSMNKVDEQVVNTGTLFTFLKMERFLPQSLFATVELSSSANMAVLNATIMRRFRETAEKTMKVNRGTLIVTTNTNKPLTSNHIEHGAHAKNSATPTKSGGGNSAKDPRGKNLEGRRSAALFDGNGRFATKRATVLPNIVTPNLRRTGVVSAQGPLAPAKPSIHRGSVMGSAMSSFSSSLTNMVDDAMDSSFLSVFESTIEELWDAMDTHHVLPVFAAAKAFVPGSFEALLVQGYYVKLTPVICEKFVCGQFGQTMCSLPVPKELVGRRFMDLFRLFIANQVVCLGLYRAPQLDLGATLPYVYMQPPTGTILAAGDRVYVFGDRPNLQRCKIALSMCSKWTRGT